MRTALLFFAVIFASANVAFCGLAGLAVNGAASAVSRETRFDIVSINPVTGQASSTQKQVFALNYGTLDVNNFVVGPGGWALSLQAFDLAQVNGQTNTNFIDNSATTNPVGPRSEWAYLARQDLNQNGRFEFCQLSLTNRPINIFWDSASSVVATVVTPSGFALTRISFSETSRFCDNALLANLPVITGVLANVKASRGNRIYIVTEPSGGFTASSGLQIRAFDIAGNVVTTVTTTQLLSSIFPTSIHPMNGDMVTVNGFLAPTTAGASAPGGTAGTFISYDINLSTYSSTATTAPATRSITAGTEEITYASVFTNQTSSIYSLKNVAPTASTSTTFLTTPQVTTLLTTSTSTSETKGTTTTLNSLNVINLFNLPTIGTARIDVLPTLITNIQLSGSQWLFAGVATAGTGNIAATSVSTCRFTYTNLGSSVFTATTVATGSGDVVTCPMTTAPLVNTLVSVEFSSNGVQYATAGVFNYGGSIARSRFIRSVYNARDGTAFESTAESVAVELLDAQSNKVLFSQTTTTTATITATSNQAIRSTVGATASVSNGVAVFPNLAVDVDSSDNTDIVPVTLTHTVGTTSATATLNVQIIRATRGTVGALAFPTAASTTTAQVFDLQLVNPSAAVTSTSILKIGATRAFADTTATNTLAPSLALGLTAYDRDNRVLNTVEVTVANTLLLNGVSIFATAPSATGTGVCIIPTTTSQNDSPVSIWYEGTDASSRASTFLAVVRNTDLTAGSGHRLVRITRAAGSTSTTQCTLATVDNLPIFDTSYGNLQIVPLTNDRIAFIEPDSFFTYNGAATGQTAAVNNAFGASLLSVWRFSRPSANPAIAGRFIIRNKVLSGFSIVSITQSARDELAISGFSNAGSTTGLWLVDISRDNTAVVAPSASGVTLYASATPFNDQAFFLAGGSEASFADNRYRVQGSVAPQTTFVSTSTALRTNVETIQLLRGSVSANPRNFETTGRNYVSFFQLDDPLITAVTPNAVARGQTATVLATVNNVLASNLLTCRFSSLPAISPLTQAAQLRASLTATSTSLTTTTATALLSADGQIVDCGTIPSTHLANDAYVYLQISNDGLNWGPEAKIAVGNVAAIVSAAPAAPTASVVPGVTTNTFFVQVSGDFLNTGTNEATLRAILSTTVLNLLNSFGRGSWSISSAFTVTGTSATATNRSTFTITYQVTVRTNRLAALQTGTQALADVNAALAANQAALSAIGATTTASLVSGSTGTTSDDDDLSGGAIAGIVIAVVVGFFLIVGAIAFFVVKSKNSSATNFSQSRNYDARASSSSDYDGDYSDYSDSDYSDYV